MTIFLPEGYTTPEIKSNYMEFEEGQNAIRFAFSQAPLSGINGGLKPAKDVGSLNGYELPTKCQRL